MTTAADQLRAVVPHRLRRRIAHNRVRLRQPSSALRSDPHFLLIGAQRSGTSSLYRWLGAHPQVVPSLRKETEYLSAYYGRGPAWYHAHFPLKARRKVTFEATPDYLVDPRTPQRASALLPDARLVVVLRQPESRSISHYHHMVRLGYETLDLAEAMGCEEQRLEREWTLMEEDPLYEAAPFRRYSYIARSRYAEQLERWFEVFAREQFLILRSEDLFEDPVGSFAEILDFLQLDPWTPPAFANYSYSPTSSSRPSYRAPDREALAVIQKGLGDQPAQLIELLGDRFSWDPL